ncbi:metallophosphatase family protein [Deinococcus sp. HMF7604]|uniref:metallophosphoesterase family protein n=1 Tax=Deinococcus betulae TaxID=2873312 RepID=UPI001CCE43A9|nr:metallophosphoesterase family protein [Deinococcus betulae]MBZ9751010.1 metallophosphatase family protein [Deinococcus betulae]
MRLAILGDVHGNAFALAAVLADIQRHAPDLTINLGDQAEGSADPARALALQAELAAGGAVEVRGNNEEKLWPGGRRSPLSLAYGAWLAAQTPPGALTRIAGLPLEARALDGAVYACHGTPHSAWESLLWVWDPAGFYRAREPRDLRALVEPLGAEVVLCGHTHRAGATRVGDTLVVNAGAVSDQVDGDPRARWTRLDQVGGAWQVSFHAVAYDIEAAVAWSCAHTPFGEGEAKLLRTGTMDGRGDGEAVG